MTYHYSRLQRLRWKIGDLLARLLTVGVLIGVVEAGQACGTDQIPVLESVATVMVNDGNRIEVGGVPVWGCAERQ